MQTATSMQSVLRGSRGWKFPYKVHFLCSSIDCRNRLNCMEPSPSSEADGFSDGQEISCIIKS